MKSSESFLNFFRVVNFLSTATEERSFDLHQEIIILRGVVNILPQSEEIDEGLFAQDNWKKSFSEIVQKFLTEEEINDFLNYKLKEKIGWNDFSDSPDFTFYLFERRFGWSESGYVPSFQCSFQDFNRLKHNLNHLIDILLKTFQKTSLSSIFSKMVINIVKRTDKPVVREQTYRYFLEWIKVNIETDVNFASKLQKYFDVINDVIVGGITDVWSAIRKKTGLKLYAISQFFSLSQIERLYKELISICLNGNSIEKNESHSENKFRASTRNNWQEKEGSLFGIMVLIKRFNVIHSHAPNIAEEQENDGKKTSLDGGLMLSFGNQHFTELPSFIKESLKEVIYKLSAHEQVTIREHSMKVFAAYLSRCGFLEVQCSVFEIIKKLKNLDKNGKEQFLGAFQSDGLLSICEILISKLPWNFVLFHWKELYPTFLRYLSHSASTVRQKASSIVLILLNRSLHHKTDSISWIHSSVKSRSNSSGNNEDVEMESAFSPFVNSLHLSIVKIIFQSLAADWGPCGCKDTNPAPTTAFINARKHKRNKSRDKLISDVEAPVHSSWPPSLSELAVSETEANVKSEKSELNQEKKWEWMEGRLLAYELIFERLYQDHVETSNSLVSSSSSLSDFNKASDIEKMPQKDSSERSSSEILKNAEHGNLKLNIGRVHSNSDSNSLSQVVGSPTPSPVSVHKSFPHYFSPPKLEYIYGTESSSNSNLRRNERLEDKSDVAEEILGKYSSSNCFKLCSLHSSILNDEYHTRDMHRRSSFLKKRNSFGTTNKFEHYGEINDPNVNERDMKTPTATIISDNTKKNRKVTTSIHDRNYNNNSNENNSSTNEDTNADGVSRDIFSKKRGKLMNKKDMEVKSVVLKRNPKLLRSLSLDEVFHSTSSGNRKNSLKLNRKLRSPDTLSQHNLISPFLSPLNPLRSALSRRKESVWFGRYGYPVMKGKENGDTSSDSVTKMQSPNSQQLHNLLNKLGSPTSTVRLNSPQRIEALTRSAPQKLQSYLRELNFSAPENLNENVNVNMNMNENQRKACEDEKANQLNSTKESMESLVLGIGSVEVGTEKESILNVRASDFKASLIEELRLEEGMEDMFHQMELQNEKLYQKLESNKDNNIPQKNKGGENRKVMYLRKESLQNPSYDHLFTYENSLNPNITSTTSSVSDSKGTVCMACLKRTQYKQLRLVSFSSMLRHIMVQVISCSFHDRWEIRRMADQVLPHLFRVACHFDLKLSFFNELWNEFIRSSNINRVCVASISLKYIIRASLDLAAQYNVNTIRNRKDRKKNTYLFDGLKSEAVIVVERLYHILRSDVISDFFQICHSSFSDRLIILCVEVIVLIRYMFSATLNIKHEEDVALPLNEVVKEEYVNFVIRTLEKIRKHSYNRQMQIQGALTNKGGVKNETNKKNTMDLNTSQNDSIDSLDYFYLPQKPFCSPSQDNARTVEQWIVSCTHLFFGRFLEALHIKYQMTLLPYLCGYIVTYDFKDMRLSFLEALETHFKQISNLISEHSEPRKGLLLNVYNVEEKNNSVKSRSVSMFEKASQICVNILCLFLQDRCIQLEGMLVKRLLDILCRITTIFCDLRFLPKIFQTIHCVIRKVNNGVPIASAVPLNYSKTNNVRPLSASPLPNGRNSSKMNTFNNNVNPQIDHTIEGMNRVKSDKNNLDSTGMGSNVEKNYVGTLVNVTSSPSSRIPRKLFRSVSLSESKSDEMNNDMSCDGPSVMLNSSHLLKEPHSVFKSSTRKISHSPLVYEDNRDKRTLEKLNDNPNEKREPLDRTLVLGLKSKTNTNIDDNRNNVKKEGSLLERRSKLLSRLLLTRSNDICPSPRPIDDISPIVPNSPILSPQSRDEVAMLAQPIPVSTGTKNFMPSYHVDKEGAVRDGETLFGSKVFNNENYSEEEKVLNINEKVHPTNVDKEDNSEIIDKSTAADGSESDFTLEAKTASDCTEGEDEKNNDDDDDESSDWDSWDDEEGESGSLRFEGEFKDFILSLKSCVDPNVTTSASSNEVYYLDSLNKKFKEDLFPSYIEKKSFEMFLESNLISSDVRGTILWALEK